MKNEKTSAHVASVAGRMLKALERVSPADSVRTHPAAPGDEFYVELGTVRELSAVLASALTQAPDKSRGERGRRKFARGIAR